MSHTCTLERRGGGKRQKQDFKMDAKDYNFVLFFYYYSFWKWGKVDQTFPISLSLSSPPPGDFPKQSIAENSNRNILEGEKKSGLSIPYFSVLSANLCRKTSSLKKNVALKLFSKKNLRLPNQQCTLNKLPTELRCRNLVNKNRLSIQIGRQRCKNVCAICGIYSNWAFILHTTVAGWVRKTRLAKNSSPLRLSHLN